MTIRETILAALTGISLLASTAHAGGPVIVEDTAEAAPVVRDRNALPLVVIAALIVGGLLANGGSDACQGPDDTPEPPKGGC